MRNARAKPHSFGAEWGQKVTFRYKCLFLLDIKKDIDNPKIDHKLPNMDDGTNSLEHDRLRDALTHTGGNTELAAEMLGVSKKTVLRRMRAYGIPVRRGRPVKLLGIHGRHKG